jgi:hypothetical protein
MTVEAGDKIVSTCEFKGLYIIATENAVYACGDEKKIRKIFPDAHKCVYDHCCCKKPLITGEVCLYGKEKYCKCGKMDPKDRSRYGTNS